MCQRNDPDLGKLWGSGKERDTLVGNMKSIWDVEKEKDNINCDHHSFIRYNNGSPDFKIIFEHHSAVFHHRCTGKYSKQKVDRLKKQQKENKERAVFTRSSSSSKPVGSPFCAICDKEDDEGNLPAAGTQGATKNALDTQYNAKLTKWWKDMAIKTNNDSFLAKLATGTLASNEIFYHLNCYSSMSRNYQRIIEGKDEHQIEEHWIKAACFESIITVIIEEEESQKGLSFAVREFNEMYIHMLQEYGISETVNTTRFVAKLIESLPNLHSSRRKDGKTIVMFDQQVDNVIRDYVETPDELCASL